MKELVGHKHPEWDDGVKVYRVDEPDENSVPHEYAVEYWRDGELRTLRLEFQRGPLLPAGPNGLFDSALVEILIDRFEGYVRGPYTSPETESILDQLILVQEMISIATGVMGTWAK